MNIRDLKIWAVAGPALVMALGAGGAAVVAVLIFAYRCYVFLRDGFWLTSLCEVTYSMRWYGANVWNACQQFQSEWAGVDRIINGTLNWLDASVLWLLIAFACWLLMVLYMGVVSGAAGHEF